MTREGIFVEGLWVEPKNSTPSHDSKPPERIENEIGLSSAPLLSASFHLAAYCKDFNQDFMACKNLNSDGGKCKIEGQKVTRCSIDFVKKLMSSCGELHTKHWQCLDANNQILYKCRPEEKELNACVFDKMGLEKVIPDTPAGSIPVHLVSNPRFK